LIVFKYFIQYQLDTNSAKKIIFLFFGVVKAFSVINSACRAGATPPVYVYVLGVVHRSGKLSVNHKRKW